MDGLSGDFFFKIHFIIYFCLCSYFWKLKRQRSLNGSGGGEERGVNKGLKHVWQNKEKELVFTSFFFPDPILLHHFFFFMFLSYDFPFIPRPTFFFFSNMSVPECLSTHNGLQDVKWRRHILVEIWDLIGLTHIHKAAAELLGSATTKHSNKRAGESRLPFYSPSIIVLQSISPLEGDQTDSNVIKSRGETIKERKSKKVGEINSYLYLSHMLENLCWFSLPLFSFFCLLTYLFVLSFFIYFCFSFSFSQSRMMNPSVLLTMWH